MTTIEELPPGTVSDIECAFDEHEHGQRAFNQARAMLLKAATEIEIDPLTMYYYLGSVLFID